MKKLALITLVLASFTASAEDIDIKKGAPYNHVRDGLLMDRWEPSKQSTEECNTYQDQEICDNFPEIESCSGTGMGYCAMTFHKNGTYLEITTINGMDPEGKEASIHSWKFRK